MIPVVIAGIELHRDGGLTSESIEYEGGITDTRRHGGTLVRMHHWSKPVITVSASGPRPAELDGIGLDQPITVYLTKMQSAASASNVIPLTSSPRPDFPPVGHGVVAGELVKTPVVVAGGVATLSLVPGATQYRVDWMPQFSVLPDPISASMSNDAMHSWTFKGKAV